MGTLASGSIDLKSLKVAGEGASKYITEINNGGISVHDASSNSNYVAITSSGMEVYAGTSSSNKVAEFKSYINIGSGNNNNSKAGSALIGTGLIAENERQVILGAYNYSPNNGVFVIGGGQNNSNRANLLSVHNINGQTVTDTFIAETTASGQSFTVTNIITSITQITVDGTVLSSSNYSYTGQDVTINTSVTKDSKVEISYVTSSQRGYMVLGQAQDTFGAFSITLADSAAYGYGSIAGGDSSATSGAIKASGVGSIAMAQIISKGEAAASGTGSSVHGIVRINGTMTASGNGSSIHGYAHGSTMTASGTGAFICGYISNNSTMTASGMGSSIHGYATNNSTMTSFGTGSSVRGYVSSSIMTTASGMGSSIHGSAYNSTMTASGSGSSVYGSASESTMTASGVGSSIQGYASESTMTASGLGSSVQGYAISGSTMTASNNGSIALNESTHALKRAQLAIGSYNADDSTTTTTHPSGTIGYGTYAFIIGNGTAEDSRSNALTVDWQGNLTLKGGIAANTDKAQITSFTSGWTSYSSTVIPTVYRFGQVVVLSGQLKNTAAKTLDADEVTIFTIPTGYRPPQLIDVLCQGSSKNIFKCRVNTDGTVQFSRYRTGDGTYASISAGAWFPFHITWIVPRN